MTVGLSCLISRMANLRIDIAKPPTEPERFEKVDVPGAVKEKAVAFLERLLNKEKEAKMLKHWPWLVVLVVRLVSLIFGVVLIVGGQVMKSEVIKDYARVVGVKQQSIASRKAANNALT